MDDLVVVQHIQKCIKERKGQAIDILENNGVSSMEQYSMIMGELTALNHVAQELSFLLEQWEKRDD